MHLVKGPMYSYKKELLIDNKEAYTETAKLYKRVYKESNEEGVLRYFVSTSKEGKHAIYSSEIDNYTYLTEDEYENFKVVDENFKLDKQYLAIIIVSGGNVVFTIETGRTAFIYCTNNKKPETFYTLGEDKKIYIEKVIDNWYYGCLKK